MTTVKDFVQSICNGELVEPFWVKREATKKSDMNGKYAEVLDYFATFPDVQMRPRLGIDACTVDGCGGIVRGVESRVPGAFRVDWCCLTCGGSQTHRAGWLDADARERYRASIGSKEVG